MLTTLSVLGVVTKYSSGGWEHLSLDFHLVALSTVAFSVQIIQHIQAMLFLSSEYNVVSPFLDLITLILIICLKYVARYAVETVYLSFKYSFINQGYRQIF